MSALFHNNGGDDDGDDNDNNSSNNAFFACQKFYSTLVERQCVVFSAKCEVPLSIANGTSNENSNPLAAI